MSIPTKAKQIKLKELPLKECVYEFGKPDSTFELVEVDLPELKNNQVLLQAVYYSNDPAQRAWIQGDLDPKRLYRAAVRAGDIMPLAAAIWKVLKSTSSKFKEGSLVFNATEGWVDYSVVDDKECRPVEVAKGLKTSSYVGALGGPGLTAIVGLRNILDFQEGQTIAVSGGAGAVGNVVVQLAKHVYKSKKVVAFAGSDEKCAWLRKIGADIAINYKDKDFAKKVAEACGNDLDAYFDNVAGSTLDMMLQHVKTHGKIAACGGITGYNGQAPATFKNYMQVVLQRISILGFLVTDHMAEFPQMLKDLTGWVQEGKLSIEGAETIERVKFEDVPKAYSKLFVGGNTGKLVTQLSDE